MSHSLATAEPVKSEPTVPTDRSVGMVLAGVCLVVAWLWRANPAVMQPALWMAAAIPALGALAAVAARALRHLSVRCVN
jgi:hypothetical protein